MPCRPQWAIYTAVYLCHQYFAKRSFQRSDKYVSAVIRGVLRAVLLRVVLHCPLHTVVQQYRAAAMHRAVIMLLAILCALWHQVSRSCASPLCWHCISYRVALQAEQQSACAGTAAVRVELAGAYTVRTASLQTVLWCALPVQLVAVACLYLGCKVQESPKYLRDVIKSAETRKWAKWCDEHPTERRKWEDPVSSSVLPAPATRPRRSAVVHHSRQLHAALPCTACQHPKHS
jgi:hypothetical protein